jgi:hypothetical protein
MSIYISISCFGTDAELEQTIKSAASNSVLNSGLHFGVALIGTREVHDGEKFISELIRDLPKTQEYTIREYGMLEEVGVGAARNAAKSLYAGQDHFLQIDSHTYFSPGWDKTLVEYLEKATKITNNAKTVLTGTLGSYTYDEFGIIPEQVPDGGNFYYSIWNGEKHEEIIPSFEHDDACNVTAALMRMVSGSSLAPSVKATGAFMFGGKEFANRRPLPEGIIFWEEEIIQSIELIDEGFSLASPHIEAVLHHFYKNDETNTGRGKRTDVDKEYILRGVDWTERRAQMVDTWNSYINNPANQKKIKVFERYAGIDLRSGLVKFKHPLYYANIGTLPLGGGKNAG